MGSLITETPLSEIVATFELLDHLGVGRDDLKRFRAAAPGVQNSMAHIFKNADAVTRISTMSATPTAKPPILVLHKTTSLGDIEGKKTSGCFTDKSWRYRNNDIDKWLPTGQPAQAAGSIGVYQLQNPQGTTFREMAAAALRVGSGTSLDLLAKALKEQGHTLTLQAIEQLVERQEGGEDVGLRTDGYANFAFLEDANGSVSVLRFHRFDGRWAACVYRLDDDGGWNAECRLLLRNSDASAL